MTTLSRIRTRWAAVGAAIAISIAGGGVLQIVDAADSAPSVFVAVDPVRILDTRDGVDVGLAGPFVSGVGQKLDVTGSIPTTTGTATVVPDGATGVVLNVTGIRPDTAGFISVRPGTATGVPTTSNLNVLAGQNVPNAVTVQLPTSGAASGQIEIFYQGATFTSLTNVLIDVVGYYTVGPAGPAGPQGDTGPAGMDAPAPSNVVWVAQSGGDFTSVQAAIDSITDASSTNPYVVKIAPGTYAEVGIVELKSNVDLQGSGMHATIIETVRVNGDGVDATISHLTISATATELGSIAAVNLSNPGVSLVDVRVDASVQNGQAIGVFAEGSGAVTIRDSHILAHAFTDQQIGVWADDTVVLRIDGSEIRAASPAGLEGIGFLDQSTGQHRIADSTISAKEVVVLFESGTTIEGSTLVGLIGTVGPDGEGIIATSQVSGSLDHSTGAQGHTCVHSYDADGSEVDASCQTIP